MFSPSHWMTQHVLSSMHIFSNLSQTHILPSQCPQPEPVLRYSLSQERAPLSPLLLKLETRLHPQVPTRITSHRTVLAISLPKDECLILPTYPSDFYSPPTGHHWFLIDSLHPA
jgi:hypothetical protein